MEVRSLRSDELDGLCSRWQTPGRVHMGVSVADNNHDAERLYIRLGYRPSGVFDVSEYDWVSDDGRVHHAIERNQLMVKAMGFRRIRTLSGRH